MGVGAFVLRILCSATLLPLHTDHCLHEKANMDLEFSDDQLNQVSFTFEIEKDAKEWIQKEVDELNSLYGSGETTGLGNQIYQWKGEQNTVLQMTAFSKNDEKATVILGVASFEYSVGS